MRDAAARATGRTLLLLLGDQVYADEVSPATARLHPRAPRHGRAAGREVADFEEYSPPVPRVVVDPAMRWLLSTVPSAMIFDDHDVHDDWNTSALWVRGDARARLVGRADRRRRS